MADFLAQFEELASRQPGFYSHDPIQDVKVEDVEMSEAFPGPDPDDSGSPNPEVGEDVEKVECVEVEMEDFIPEASDDQVFDDNLVDDRPFSDVPADYCPDVEMRNECEDYAEDDDRPELAIEFLPGIGISWQMLETQERIDNPSRAPSPVQEQEQERMDDSTRSTSPEQVNESDNNPDGDSETSSDTQSEASFDSICPSEVPSEAESAAPCQAQLSAEASYEEESSNGEESSAEEGPEPDEESSNEEAPEPDPDAQSLPSSPSSTPSEVLLCPTAPSASNLTLPLTLQALIQDRAPPLSDDPPSAPPTPPNSPILAPSSDSSSDDLDFSCTACELVKSLHMQVLRRCVRRADERLDGLWELLWGEGALSEEEPEWQAVYGRYQRKELLRAAERELLRVEGGYGEG